MSTEQELSEARSQLRLAKVKRALRKTQAELKILEAYTGSFSGNAWGDPVDPMDAFRDYDTARAFPIGFPTDRQDGRNRPFVWADFDLDVIRGQARWVADRNGLGQGILNNLTNYTIKTGYIWKAQPGQGVTHPAAPALAAQVQACIDQFGKRNNAPARERSAFRRSRRDGDVAVRFFRQTDGTTLLRFVESEQIRTPPMSPDNCLFGVETNPDDVEDTWAYHVAYRPEDYERVPAEEIALLKLNVDECVKRGLSDFFSAAESLDGVWKFLRNMRESGSVQAAVAWIEQFEGATPQSVGAQVAAARDQRRTYFADPVTGKEVNYQRVEPGQVVKVGKGRNYLSAPLAANTTQHISIVQACLRALGVRWCMPEFIISGEADEVVANAMVSGSPFVTMIECEQATVYEPYFKRWRWTAVRNAANAGLFVVNDHVFTAAEVEALVDITGTPPIVAIESKEVASKVDHQDLVDGVISKQHRQAKLGVDSAKMASEIAADPYVQAPAPERITANVDAPDELATDDEKTPDGTPAVPSTDPPEPPAPPTDSSANTLRATVGGSAQVAALQTAFYAGQMPRDAAIANAVIIFGFSDEEANRLFSEQAPVKLTPGDPGSPPVTEGRRGFFPKLSRPAATG